MLSGIGQRKPKPKDEKPKFEIVEAKPADDPYEGTATTVEDTVSVEPDRSEEEDIEVVVEENQKLIDADLEEQKDVEVDWTKFLLDDFVRDCYEMTLKAIKPKFGSNHVNAITERVMDKSMRKGGMVLDCLEYGIWSGDLIMPRTNYYQKVEPPVAEDVPTPTWGDKSSVKSKKKAKKGGFKTKPEKKKKKQVITVDPTVETCVQCGVPKGDKHLKTCLSWVTGGGEADNDGTKTEGMQKLIDKVVNGNNAIELDEFAVNIMNSYSQARATIGDTSSYVAVPWNTVTDKGKSLFREIGEILLSKYDIRDKR